MLEYVVDIASKEVCFDVDFCTDSICTYECLSEGMGDDGEAEAIFIDIIDSEAYTIYSDRAFGNDMGYILRLYSYDEVGSVTPWSDRFDDSYTIYMPLDDMPYNGLKSQDNNQT